LSSSLKTCFKCRQTKALSQFYHHPKMRDGHLGKCKECTKRDTKLNYAKNREYYHEYNRQQAQTAKVKERRAESQRRTRLRHPQKYRAWTALNNAIRDGMLTKEPCEICGASKAQGHHDDHSKPLVVRWLCFKCHRETEHGQVVTALPF